MAARRDRERRRPEAASRYRFAAPESVVDSEEAATDGDAAGAVDAQTDRSRRSTRTAAPAESRYTAASTRGGSRPAPPPFSAYAAEYAYVIKDLRRVGLVIGSLLVILILLYFVLPH